MQPTQGTHVTPGFRAKVIAEIPMKRLGLASAESSFCTGAVPDVSGSRATY
jgi:hypothetical protein